MKPRNSLVETIDHESLHGYSRRKT